MFPLLTEAKFLVVFFGVGLSSAELIVLRLLRQARQEVSGHNWLGLEVCDPLDHLFHLNNLGIQKLRLPVGLCASSKARGLALLALLEFLVKRYKETLKLGISANDALQGIQGLLEDPVFGTTFNGTKLARSQPLVISTGVACWNRMVGLETSIAQEGAYRSKTATSKPQENEKQPLSRAEIGGQAVVPCLIWDKLGIPSALTSQVRDDGDGLSVVESLAQTEWLRFTEVQQLTEDDRRRLGDTEKPFPRETENCSYATWFGVRTILDHAPRFEFLAKADIIAGYRPDLLYVTKNGWQNVRDQLSGWPGNRREPLVVFETGGIGDLVAEMWASSHGGIILSSATAALRWFALTTKKKVTGHRHWFDRRQDWDTQFYFKKASSPLPEGARTWQARDWDEFGEGFLQSGKDWFARWRSKYEPKDDRGRLHQVLRLFDLLSRIRDRVPLFLRGALCRARLYAITIGEMGIVYWLRSGSDWSGPYWSHCAEPAVRVRPGPQQGFYDQMRNASECGDAARAGFVAALLVSGFPRTSQDSRIDEQIRSAMEWANCFGAWKLRFFFLADYLTFLSEHSRPIVDAMKARKIADFGEEFNLFPSTEKMYLRGNLIPLAEDWLEDHRQFYRSPSSWGKKAEQWSRSRDFEDI